MRSFIHMINGIRQNAVLIVISFFFMVSSGFSKPVKYPVVQIKTQSGDIFIWLYDDTPLHKANFIKLAKEGFYNKTKFHRIIKDFMIQAGDPNTKNADKDLWGHGGPGYTINAEILPKYFHKKGVISAARLGDPQNPTRMSSGSQFYIVQGAKYDQKTLDFIEKQVAKATGNPAFKFTEEMRKVYEEIGGAPHLDMQYTVFGEVISGLDVVDKIASVNTGVHDKPLTNIEIEVNILEMSAKQIEKKWSYAVPVSEK